MRTARSPLPPFAILAALALAMLPARALQAQQEYPQSLYWGTGLIDIPVAPVSPITGDFAFSYMGKKFTNDPSAEKINYNNSINSQLTFGMAFFGRLEAGVAAYSSNPEQGFFGRATLLRQSDMATGLARWMPSVGVGVRNVGPYKHIDRFGCCYRLIPPHEGEPNATHAPSALHGEFNTANTVYGVATEEFSLANIRSSWPDVNFSITAGYGNGLFKDDGGLGSAYAGHSTGGLFYGIKSDFTPGRNVTVSLMAENNAWDYNVGGSLYYRGLRAGLYVTELGAGNKASGTDTLNAAGALYRYSKVAFSIGWQSNIFALLRGDFLQNRAAELERQRQGLLAEIEKRRQRIAALELEINRYEAQNLLELEQRRAQAEGELRQEREALRRLEDRLKRVEQQAPAAPVVPSTTPPTTPPPSTTPPTTPPPGTPGTTSPTAR